MSTSGLGSSGIASLLQTLSNEGVPSLSSANVKAALEKAPAKDIVALSVAASKLQGIGQLFGNSESSQTSNDPVSNIFASLEQSAAGQTSNSGAPTTLQTQLANLQSQETQSLFGSSSGTNQPSGSLLNLIG